MCKRHDNESELAVPRLFGALKPKMTDWHFDSTVFRKVSRNNLLRNKTTFDALQLQNPAQKFPKKKTLKKCSTMVPTIFNLVVESFIPQLRDTHNFHSL